MAFFNNKRRDFSIQPPRQQVDSTPFFVTDSANIDFTLENLNLTANLTTTGITAGTYGSATLIPILTLDQYGRVTGVSTTTFSASGVSLETNGTPNPVQTLLNLVAGTNMTITDDGLGNITFTSTGGSGGTYTVDNGLSPNPTANNFQLGGPLIKNTTISTGNFFLSLNGTLADPNGLFRVETTGTLVTHSTAKFIHNGPGRALDCSSLSGTGLVATSNTGSAIFATSTSDTAAFLRSISGIGLYSQSTSSEAIQAFIIPSSVNDVRTVLTLRRATSGVPANGIGSSIDFYNSTSSGGSNLGVTNRLKSLHTEVDNFTRISQFEITSVNSNIESTTFTLKGTGQLQLNKYTGATFDDTATKSLGVDASGNVITFTGGGGGSGTVTSVAATVPTPTNPAFSVAVPNPTTTPSIDITANGIVSQYIRGDGSLANFPSSGGGGSSLNYYLNGSVSQGTLDGVAFRQMSSTPVIGAGTNFSISSDGYIQSFITDASVPNQLLIPAGNWLFEMYFQSSSAGGSPRFYIELYKLSGGTLSLIASSATNPEFITNGTAVDLYTTAVAVPSTVLLAADRLAVRVYVIHSGRTITLHTEDSNLCEVITTFSTGITALNGLTAQIQNLTTGTSGTDFGITSATDTHTFNLPTASATNRGALSSADWTVFNGKQDALILTTTGSSGPATLTGATLNIPQYSGGSGGITALTGDVAASGTGSVVATLASNLKTGSFGVTVDGVTGVVQVGNIGYVVMPYAGTITGWSITSNVVGTVSFDITSASGAIPTISIITSGYPTISGTNFATSTSVGGWSTSFAAGDVFGFSVRSSPAPSLIKNATLTIRTTRS
jgi:hypothetical protein